MKQDVTVGDSSGSTKLALWQKHIGTMDLIIFKISQ